MVPYYVITLGLVVLATVFVFLIVRNASIEKEQQNLSVITTQVAEQVDAYIRTMDNLALQVFADPGVRELLKSANEDADPRNYFTHVSDARDRLRSRLLTVSGPLITALRVAVFSLNGDHLDFGLFTMADRLVAESLEDTPWVRTVYERSGGKVIVSPHYDPWSGKRDYKVVSVARALRYELDVYGFVQVDQPFPTLLDILQIDHPAVAMAIVAPDGSSVAATDDYDVDQMHAGWLIGSVADLSRSLRARRVDLADQVHFVLTTPLKETDWSLVVTVPYRSLSSMPPALIMVFLAVLVLAAAFLFGVEYLISRRISTPVREISDRLREVRLDDIALDLPAYKDSNELNYLKDSMEAMFRELRTSADRLARARAAEVTAEFQALQAQIHPHFLYNLFSVIGAIARAEGGDRLVRICSEAGDMLRYASRRESDLVTIADELTYAKNYSYLMEQRFENGLTATFDVDDSISTARCPKLFLQPIIENCYAHGFKRTAPPWRVIVTGWMETVESDSYWLIRVVDNGTGFEQPFDRDRPPAGAGESTAPGTQHGGIGLGNIYKRFQIEYGRRMVFRLQNGSREFGDAGATVEIGGVIAHGSQSSYS